MNLLSVLLTGLFAGGISCGAVQGGLLAGLITRMRGAGPVAGSPQAQVSGNRRQAQEAAASQRTSVRLQLTDDLVPVGGFLVGKLVSHTILGAVLGALGGVAQLSVSARTTVQIIAGLVIIAFALAQLGLPGFRRLVVAPPRSWTRVVRNRTRSRSALAPALLGFAMVLLPCGVTLSVQALALASGSWLSGAIIMAVFVLGTVPLFTLLGYTARRASAQRGSQLAAATGVVVLLMGLYTLNGGLELAGSRIAASRIVQAMSSEKLESSAIAASAVTRDAAGQTVVIRAVSGAYTPDDVSVAAGVPTTLIIRADNARGCVRSFVIPNLNVEEILPVQGDTRIDLGVLPPGDLEYACSMGMYTGVITAS